MKWHKGREGRRHADEDVTALHPWRLSFLDADLEAGFRAAERDRNLRQARFGIAVGLVLNIVFGAFDPMLLADEDIAFVSTLRLGVLTPALVLLIALSYAPYYRTRWPVLLIATEWLFAVVYGIINAYADVPDQAISGFVLVILGAYMLLPLIFQYGEFAAWVATLIYMAILVTGPNAEFDVLMVASLQLIAANIIGMFALYRSERFRRLDHLKSLRLGEERGRFHDLLTSILPSQVADRLQRGGEVADEVEDASVLFADIVGFTALASRSKAPDVVDFLNRTFAAYDTLVARHGLEKIKTIGDCYMVAGGVPGTTDDHLPAMARLALDMRAAAADLRWPDGTPVNIRIGLHCGDVLAGVIGESRFLYDLWGDTVNVASRMERLAGAGEIQVSDAVRRRLQDRFAFVSRGEIEVKGKGPMPTWYLTGPLDGGPVDSGLAMSEAVPVPTPVSRPAD